MQTKLGT